MFAKPVTVPQGSVVDVTLDASQDAVVIEPPLAQVAATENQQFLAITARTDNIQAQLTEGQPLRESGSVHHTGIDSAIPLPVQQSVVEKSSTSFSIPLHNVVDEIIRPDTDAQPDTSPLLELVHDASAVDAQVLNESSAIVPYENPEGSQNDNVDMLVGSQPVRQEVNPSKNIQHGLDLWDRVREYDARTATEGTDGLQPVLRRNQKQKLRVQSVLSQQPSKSRTRGDNNSADQ